MPLVEPPLAFLTTFLGAARLIGFFATFFFGAARLTGFFATFLAAATGEPRRKATGAAAAGAATPDRTPTGTNADVDLRGRKRASRGARRWGCAWKLRARTSRQRAATAGGSWREICGMKTEEEWVKKSPR